MCVDTGALWAPAVWLPPPFPQPAKLLWRFCELGDKPFAPSDGFLGLFTVPCPFRRASAVARNAAQRFDVYEVSEPPT